MLSVSELNNLPLKTYLPDSAIDRAREDLRAGDYFSALERMIYAVTGEFLERSPPSFTKQSVIVDDVSTTTEPIFIGRA